jgi:hypothetical protein
MTRRSPDWASVALAVVEPSAPAVVKLEFGAKLALLTIRD